MGTVVGQYDATGQLIADYTQGLGLVSQVGPSGGAAYYDFDSVGSTIGISGQAGSYLDSYSYLPFGEVSSASGSLPNPFQYNGQAGVMAQGNGLDYMRSRWYDPSQGRFTQSDPMGLAGGTNLYAYAGNNPVSFADPSGLNPAVVIVGDLILSPELGAAVSGLEEGVVATVPACAEAANTLLPGGIAAGDASLAANYLSATGVTSFAAPRSLALEVEAQVLDLAEAGASQATQDATRSALLTAGGRTVASTGARAPTAAGYVVGGVLLATGAAVLGISLYSIYQAEHMGHLPPCDPSVPGALNYIMACDDTPISTANVSTVTSSTTQVAPADPNFLAGPVGYGPAGYVPVQATLPYVIDFENEPDASAPAHQVVVTQSIDPNLDGSTFQLGDFGFGNIVIHVPAGRQSYSTRIDARSTVGVYVDVTADFNRLTGVVTWSFTSIDPTTLDQPTGNPQEGFLPPDTTKPLGEGWVSYSVQPKANDPTGTVITAQASIVFDTNAAIATNPASNTIDAGPPTSSVAPLPTASLPQFTVSWSGQDDPGGSGIASYDIYVSDDGGPFTLWQSGTTQTSAVYTGAVGHTYTFYSVATDNVGNVEAAPSAPEAETTVISPLALTAIGAVAPNPRNAPVSTIDVTFSEPINTSSLTAGALTLTDNSGPNLVTSAVTLSLVSGSTYQIGGLAGQTGAEGNYTLTVNAADIPDQYGNFGTGMLSTSWLMDTTPPASSVNPLPRRGSSLSFTISVNGSDPGATPSGVASYDIYASTNGGPWSLWTTLPASSPTATFTGQSNTTYAFYSIAHDLAGNTEAKTPVIEAITYIPDLTPPVTAVHGTTGTNPSTVNSGTGTFTLEISGSDTGGSGLAYFEVWVSIDAQPPVEIGPAIPAGAPDSSGIVHAAISYQGLAEGVTHQYRFFSTGIDGAGNVEAAHAAPNDAIFSQAFAPQTALAVTGLTVEHGAAERSYIRYLDIAFNESDGQSGGQLTQIADSVGSASPEIQLYKYDLNGDPSSKTAVSLGSPVHVAVLDHAIELDFGAYGIGEASGSQNTTAADGYYELDIVLPNGQTAVHHFDRLLGDVTGDGVVDSNDLNAVAAAVGQSTPADMTALNADVNGDGSVTAFDMTLVTRSKGRKLGPGLSLG